MLWVDGVEGGVERPYIGERMDRISKDELITFLDDIIGTMYRIWPDMLLQFEDFSNDSCFEILERYRGQRLCFN